MSADDLTRSARPAWLLLGVALLIVAATAAFGALRYANLPERFAVHWNGAGVADRYADKSIAAAFSGVFVGLGVVLLFAVISLLISRLAGSRKSAGRKAPSVPSLAAAQVFLGVISIGLALVFWLVNQQIWAATGSTVNPLLMVLLVVLGIAIAAIFANRRYQAVLVEFPSATNPDGTAADPRDAERYWVGGFIYDNPQDRAVLVPKRSGLGFTVNWGRPAGKALLLGLLAIPVLAIVLPIVLSSWL